MKILLIGNISDRRCGFANFTQQTYTALQRAGQDVTLFDGTYGTVYERHQQGNAGFFPHDIESYDVVHLIWHAMTLNHYNGANWAIRPKISWWDGGPSDASCPFKESMQIRWSDYPREGYHYAPYPVPDWVTDLPPVAETFTVGVSSVRGDGVAEVRAICDRHGWGVNLPVPGQWLPLEDEIRRLARSTVNVCWYNTPPLWHNRASAPSMLLAAGRPILINQDPLVAHLWAYPEADGVFHGKRFPATEGPNLETCLVRLAECPMLPLPITPAADLAWSRVAQDLVTVWEG